MTDREILSKAFDKAFKNGWKPSDPPKPFLFLEYFSHDFARAFWKINDELLFPDLFWKKCLSEMVLEENPIKYLERFL